MSAAANCCQLRAASCCHSFYKMPSGSMGVSQCVCAAKRFAARYAASCCQLLSQRTSYLIFQLTHTLSMTSVLPVGGFPAGRQQTAASLAATENA